MQYLVTGRDGDDPEALNRRLAVRQQHLELSEKLKQSGNLLFATATLNERGEMAGSVMVLEFDSPTQLDDWLAIEPYVTGDVWRSIDVQECRVGSSFTSKAKSL